MGHVRRRDSSTSPSPREALELEKLRAEVRNLERQGTWVSRLVSFVPLASVGVAAVTILNSTAQWRTEKQLERDAAEQARVQRELERTQELEDSAAQRFQEAYGRISSASESERIGALAYMMARADGASGEPLTKDQSKKVVLLLARSIAIEPSAAVRRAEISAVTQLMRFSPDPDVARQAIDALIESNRGLYEEHAMYRAGRIVMDTTRFYDGPIEPSGPYARAMSAGYAMVDIMRLSPTFRPTPAAEPSWEGRGSNAMKFCKKFGVYDFSRLYCPTCDFSEIDVPCALFVDAILQLSDFSRGDLRAANFDRAELDGAWFVETDLRGAEFETDAQDRSEMQFVSAHHLPLLTHLFERGDAVVAGINFRWRGPNFRCSDLRNVDFGWASVFSLVSDRFRNSYPDIYLHPSDFQASNLEGANLTYALTHYLLMDREQTLDGTTPFLRVPLEAREHEAAYAEDAGLGHAVNHEVYSRNISRYSHIFHESHWQHAQLPPWLTQHLEENGTQRWDFGVECERRDRQNDRRARLPPNAIDILKRFDSKYIIARPDPPFVVWLRQSSKPPAAESSPE